MNVSNSVRGFLAVSAAALALGGCNKPPAPAEAPVTPPAAAAPVADGWTATGASAMRTVALQGGGALGMTLTCDFRPSKGASANGFWLKLALELRSPGGVLGLDPLTTDGQNAKFAVVRSTGEASGMLLTITDPTHFVYENNQTADFDQSNKDPAKVELASKFDLPLSDGRVVTIDMLKDDAGYKAVLTQCVALAPK
jgi:hypothetical protein